MLPKDTKRYSENISKQTTRPIYKKRYKDNGEEYLKKVDEIEIEEDLKEKALEIERIKELLNTQERLKAEELLDDLTNEEFLQTLKDLSNTKELDTYQYLNMVNEMKEIYNKFPQEIRIKYPNIKKFSNEYLPNFINEQSKKIELKKTTTTNQTNITQELQKQIEELQKQINGGEKTNV